MSVGWRASRRRHTRSLRDWSSDVCSSDLLENFAVDSRRRNTLVFISKAFRHPGIRACFAYGNRLQNFPSPHLKLRTNRRQWNIELEAFAGEVIGRLRTDCFQMPMFSRHYICSQSFSQGCQFTFGCATVDKLEQSEAVVIGDGDHRSERGIDSLRKKR